MISPVCRGGNRCHTSLSRSQGFSLLEVLVAFVVLALILAVVLRVLATNTRSSALASDYAEAAIHAENLLAAVAVDADLRLGTVEAAIDERWRWRRTITSYTENGRDFNANIDVRPVRIDIEVFWMRSGRERRLNLSTLRLVKVK